MKTITHLNFAKGFRGGERQTLLLIEQLSAKGYKQTLLTRKGATLAQKASHIKNLTIITISKPYFLSLGKIKESALLHAHETKSAHFAYFAHLLYKIPYIITRRIDKSIKKSFLNNKMYLHSKKTVALSQIIKEKLYALNSDINVVMIPSALSHLKVKDKTAATIKERFYNKYLIGNIGELDNKHKGQYYLIEAAKKLQKTHPDIHFILLGKGIDAQKYKEQAKNLNNITFEGYVNNVGDYIKNFDLFVFPSLNEGLGSSLLDIMDFSVPIIATEVGGIPDIIHHDKNGLLIAPHNAHAIENAILTLYSDKQLAQRLTKQAKEDTKMYTAEVMANHYIALYETKEKDAS